jgi:catechol 2,3-dioxygenase-like lactoylglutathione lyase family enzyme
MAIAQGMDHFTVVTDRLDETVAFYGRLGLEAGARPGFAFPGCWLYLGDRAVLHLIAVTTMPEPRRGVLDHMAFSGADLAATLKVLEEGGVASRLSRLPDPFGTWQLFFYDPNGCQVELDFDPKEPGPEGWRPNP